MSTEQKTAVVLVIQGTSEIAAYACPECRDVVSSATTAGSEESAARIAAEHCRPKVCSDCGAEKPARSFCRPCNDRRNAEREAARFAKAKKVPASEYEGPVYSADGSGGDDGWWLTLEEALDDFEEGKAPPYFYGSYEVRFQLNIDHALEAEAEGGEHHDEILDQLDDVDELRAYVELWNKRQTAHSFTEDGNVAVITPTPSEETAAVAPSNAIEEARRLIGNMTHRNSRCTELTMYVLEALDALFVARGGAAEDPTETERAKSAAAPDAFEEARRLVGATVCGPPKETEITVRVLDALDALIALRKEGGA